MTTAVTPALSVGQRFGRRCAIVLMITACALILIGPGVMIVDLLWALVSGVEPNAVPESKPNTLVARYRGLLPIEVPWYGWAVIASSLAVLLSLVWSPGRHYRARKLERGVLLNATPNWIGVVSLVGLVFTFAASPFYSDAEEWPGLVWIPLALFAVVAVVGFVRGRATRPASQRRARPASKSGRPGG